MAVIAAALMLGIGPGLRRSWIGEQYGWIMGLAIGHVAAFLAICLSLVLVYRARDRIEASSLAVALVSMALLFELLVGNLPPIIAEIFGPSLDWLRRLAFHGVFIPLVATLRFASLFPKKLTADDIDWAASSEFRSRDSFQFLERSAEWLQRVIPTAWHRPLGMYETAGQFGGLEASFLSRLVKAAQSGRLYAVALGAMPVSAATFWLVTRPLNGKPAGQAFLSEVLPFVVWACVFIFAILFLLVCTGSALRINYARSDERERQRALWVVEGALSWFWILTPLFVAERLLERRLEGTPWDNAISSVGISFVALVMVGSLGFAVLYQGAIDPRLAVRRTTLYGVLASVMVLGFAIAEGLIGDLVVSRLGLPVGSGAWIAGGLVAFTFQPLHGFLRRRMDHWSDAKMPEPDLADAPRHQAIIVSSDIAGYSAFKLRDEDDALTMMSILRRAARTGAEQAKGKLTKTPAEGVLMEFEDATKAVAACQHIAALFKRACDPLGLPDGLLRTGVHLGEVAAHRDGGLFGEAVNVARRLGGEADAGQIVVSKAVADQLIDLELDDLGERTLENVPLPMRCWAVRR